MIPAQQASRVALVTGGRRGIGRAIAVSLADHGFDVVITDLECDEAARQTLAEIESKGCRAAFVKGNVADIEDHERLISDVLSAFGPLSCLVNNAGVQTAYRGDMLDVPVESFDRLISVNLRGAYFLTQEIAKTMMEQPSGDPARPQRSIIFISSGNAVIATPAQADYCISKAGIAMMASLYALRLAEHGIAVHEIRPGIIRTDMTADVFEKYDQWVKAGGMPLARWGEPEDVGRTAGALAAGLLPYSTGHAFHVDGGIHIRRT
ncbi:3-ketoacyl-ACP reductase [Nitratireductor mangrovi]|uniref:3-ketoacyl-ACP reductase n=1 Tax=Nitratireductor mangrovi TaxID=2599600 RepID=A0A5B8L340_9HYPH|nr:3-ketoacyl-ACP reductase [Nitratireductor mangrovi]QDZ02305.1 3-ketoacyl-ACP reductase [Nitratireductor mangrovi]